MREPQLGQTISQVAKAAGVSRSSVSRAFTRPDMLSAKTVARILAAADLLGYVPNPTARALSTGRNSNLALIVPDVANPFFPPLIRAAQMEADRQGFCLFLGNSDEDPRREDRLLQRLCGQVEGVILVSSRLPEDRIRATAAARPLVLINRDVGGISRVLIDSGTGVRAAVSHLAALGHRALVYVSGPRGSWSNRQRLDAVRRAARLGGLSLAIVPTPLPCFEAGYAAVSAILQTGASAIIAFDDVTAHGILAGLTARDIAVPGQMSLVGCDDVLGAVTRPALTTVSNHAIIAGQTACSLLIESLNEAGSSQTIKRLDTHLVIRATTGPV